MICSSGRNYGGGGGGGGKSMFATPIFSRGHPPPPPPRIDASGQVGARPIGLYYLSVDCAYAQIAGGALPFLFASESIWCSKASLNHVFWSDRTLFLYRWLYNSGFEYPLNITNAKLIEKSKKKKILK